jgi:hypothetical protein
VLQLQRHFPRLFCGFLILFFVSCEKKQDSVIDVTGASPFVYSVSISPSLVNSDTINIGTVRSPDDVLPLQLTARATAVPGSSGGLVHGVHYSVLLSADASASAEGDLNDAGTTPDLRASDSIWTGTIQMQFLRVTVGTFSVYIWADDGNGFQSNTVILPLRIVRSNHAPVLVGVQGDSSVSIGPGQVIQLLVRASDQDGISDILKVYFNTFKPDGSPSGGNPFLMYDDGNINGLSGDQSAGDGTYSLKISLPSGTTPGPYTFEFHAVDRSLDSSNVIIRHLTVTP